MSKRLKRIKSLRLIPKSNKPRQIITSEANEALQSIFYLDLGDALEFLSMDYKNLLYDSSFTQQIADKYEVHYTQETDPKAWTNHHMLISAVRKNRINRFEQLVCCTLLSVSIREAVILALLLRRKKIIKKALELQLPIHGSIYEDIIMLGDMNILVEFLAAGVEPTDEVLCNLVKIRDYESLKVVSKLYKIPSPRAVVSAVEHGDIEMVEILVENDANFDKFAVRVAEMEGHHNIKEYLTGKLNDV